MIPPGPWAAAVVPGVQLRYAANHWRTAVETHAANFPEVNHDVADISQVDPRRALPTYILWASLECTNLDWLDAIAASTDNPDVIDLAARARERDSWPACLAISRAGYRYGSSSRSVSAAAGTSAPSCRAKTAP